MSFDKTTNEIWAVGSDDASVLVLRFDAQGEKTLERRLTFGLRTVAHGVAITDEHGPMLVGCENAPNQRPRGWFARLDASAEVVWTAKGKEGECGHAISLIEGIGAAFVAGSTGTDAVFRRLSLINGEMQEFVSFDDGASSATAVVVVAGSVYFGGVTTSGESPRAFLELRRPDLERVWRRRSEIIDPAEDSLTALAAGDGVIVSTGWLSDGSSGRRVYLRKHSPENGFQVEEIVEEEGSGQGVAMTPGGAIFVAATVGEHIWVKRFGSDDSWEMHDGSASEARAAAAGPLGHLAVGGYEALWWGSRKAYVRVYEP